MLFLRRTHVSLFVALSCVPLALAACGGSTRSDSPAGSGGSSGGSAGSAGLDGGPTADCPPSLPSPQASCSLASGATCQYASGPCCPLSSARCVSGKWQIEASVCTEPASLPCPVTAPTEGTACAPAEPCSGTYGTCTYGKCADGSPQIIAECDGVWSVKYSNCLPPPCKGLSPCECFDRADCKPVSDGCICDCDYDCPGKPPCDCFCGGGTYLACEPAEG